MWFGADRCGQHASAGRDSEPRQHARRGLRRSPTGYTHTPEPRLADEHGRGCLPVDRPGDPHPTVVGLQVRREFGRALGPGERQHRRGCDGAS
jgi:hypothetical protein